MHPLRKGAGRRVIRLFSVVAVTLVFAYLLGGAVDQTFAGEPKAIGAAWAIDSALNEPVVSPAAVSAVQPASPAEFTGSSTRAASWPTREAMRWRAPQGWLRGAFCVHRHESVDWYRAYVDWRGYPSAYSGGMQFTLSTWRRAGGTGHPHQWRPREQVYRAFVIWRRNGGSWREWGTAWKCGLS